MLRPRNVGVVSVGYNKDNSLVIINITFFFKTDVLVCENQIITVF